ncbi:kinase-like domain-containing protein [Epithele typhae]|uniref:kinase-like domain-containing protein n=1 Tax=Epithele typhae TaxID=378194 RepID=UPI00200726A3|nr:kinase-like domain-containing protein [Epithele typhae]KAH9923461.1 kinase-like domain-containing protein [Epithele typhae]
MTAAAPSATMRLIEASTMISQGAEAKIYRARLHPPAASSPSDPSAPDGCVLLKHRFAKQYRHPTLDGALTRARVAGEARALVRCLRAGVRVPGVRMVDAAAGVLGIEWVDGASVRALLGGGAEGEVEVEERDDGEEEEGEEEAHEDGAEVALREYGLTPDQVMEMIGAELAKMHRADVVHGDLTTSNMMLRRPSAAQPAAELVLIDFGLAYISTLPEDKAVDLYVLERAFASTHPQSEPLFAGVLNAYAKGMGKDWTPVSRRLDDVRLRGRKRSMVG